MVEKGWAADRTIGRQVKTLQATAPAGVPVYFRPHPGSAGEPPAFMAAIETLAAALPPGLVIVADSGLGHLENLCAADDAHVRFVVPLRADTGWAARFDADAGPLGGLAALERLDYVSCRERRLPPGKRNIWKGLLRPFPVTSEDTGARHDLRAAYICRQRKRPRSPTPASVPWPRPRPRWAASATGSAAGTTRPGNRSTPASPRSSPASRRLITVRTGTKAGKPWITWARNAAAIADASRLDGCTRWPPTCPTPATAPR